MTRFFLTLLIALSVPVTASAQLIPARRRASVTVTNGARYSEQIQQAAVWSNASGTCTVTADQGPAGYTDMDLLDSSAAGGTVWSARQASSFLGILSTGAYATVQGLAARVSGTGVVTVQLSCGAANAVICTCTASAGTCTPAAAGSSCNGRVTIGTTPVLITVTGTCTGNTTPYISFYPGSAGSTTAQALFGRAQMTYTASPRKYCGPTTTGTKTCTFR